jgi:hypothetical protein
MVSPPAPTTGANLDRILRMLARLVSIGYVVYLVLLMPPIIVKSARLDTWWTPAAVVMVFGCGLLPGLLSFRAGIRRVRVCAAAAAVAFLLAVVTWPVARRVESTLSWINASKRSRSTVRARCAEAVAAAR